MVRCKQTVDWEVKIRYGKRVLVALLVVMTLVLVTGCEKTAVKEKEVANQPSKGGNLNYFLIEPAHIDPYNAQEGEGINVTSNICDSLVDFDPITSAIIPAVAEKWEPSEEGKVWTITLKEGTKFHNGREVEAADFKYALERIANPKTKPVPSDISYHLAPIQGFAEMQEGKATELSGVKAVDKRTLQITLTQPFSEFIFVLGHPALAPVPKEEVDKDPTAFSQKPVCNGPFKMKAAWEHDQQIVVERFDDYYGKKALLDTVTFKIFKDGDTAFVEFKAGNLDFAMIPAGQVAATAAEFGKGEYKTEKGKTALLGAESSIWYLNMNNKNEFLKNADLRRAISIAINREAIAKTVFEGTRLPATGMVPPAIDGFVDDAGAYAKYDKDAAVELLEKAGFPGGKGLPTFKISYNTGANHEAILQVIQANLKDIGINTELDGMEFEALIPLRQKGGHELASDGWGIDYPNMDSIMYPLFHSDNLGADNSSGFAGTEVDELLSSARKETDAGKRIGMYQEAEKMMLGEAPVAPVVFYAHRHVAQANVMDLVYSPMALPHLETAWIDKAEGN